jgi:hypothetical protein
MLPHGNGDLEGVREEPHLPEKERCLFDCQTGRYNSHAMLQLRTTATPDFGGLLDLLGMNLREEFGDSEGESEQDGVLSINVQGAEYSDGIARCSNEPFSQINSVTVRKHPFAGAEEDSLLGLLSHTATTWVLSCLRTHHKHRIQVVIASEWGDRQKLSFVLETET